RDLRWDPDGVRPDVPDALRIVDQYHPPGGRGMHTRYGFAMTTVLLTLSAGSPNVKTREIEYRQGDTVLQGFIAWDDAAPGKRPGVLVVHEARGPNEPARHPARRLAAAGLVGTALGRLTRRRRRSPARSRPASSCSQAEPIRSFRPSRSRRSSGRCRPRARTSR